MQSDRERIIAIKELLRSNHKRRTCNTAVRRERKVSSVKDDLSNQKAKGQHRVNRDSALFCSADISILTNNNCKLRTYDESITRESCSTDVILLTLHARAGLLDSNLIRE